MFRVLLAAGAVIILYTSIKSLRKGRISNVLSGNLVESAPGKMKWYQYAYLIFLIALSVACIGIVAVVM